MLAEVKNEGDHFWFDSLATSNCEPLTLSFLPLSLTFVCLFVCSFGYYSSLLLYLDSVTDFARLLP